MKQAEQDHKTAAVAVATDSTVQCPDKDVM